MNDVTVAQPVVSNYRDWWPWSAGLLHEWKERATQQPMNHSFVSMGKIRPLIILSLSLNLITFTVLVLHALLTSSSYTHSACRPELPTQFFTLFTATDFSSKTSNWLCSLAVATAAHRPHLEHLTSPSERERPHLAAQKVCVNVDWNMRKKNWVYYTASSAEIFPSPLQSSQRAIAEFQTLCAEW